ncbi:MAG: hypothetical protein AAFY46_13780, partial [Planctomycetota bacterium]
ASISGLESNCPVTGTLLFVDRTGPGTRIDGLVFEDAFRDGPASGDSPSNENGVFVLGAILDIVDCTFRDNSGFPGGALYVRDCHFDRLSSEFAAIHPCGLVSFGQPSAVLIQDSEFVDNVDTFGATSSGTIGASATFIDSLVLWERTSIRFSRLPVVIGGSSGLGWSQPGAWFRGSTNATVLDSMFERCSPHVIDGRAALNGISAIGAGTGVGFDSTLVSVDGCAFHNNFAAPYGVVRFWDGAGSVARSEFLGNQRYGDLVTLAGPAAGIAIGGVGGFRGDFPGFLTVVDSAFVGNSALSFDPDFPSDADRNIAVVGSFLRDGGIQRNTFAANDTLVGTLSLAGDENDNTVVRDNLIEGAGVQALSRSLPCLTRLRSLDLGRNIFEPEAAAEMALSLRSLTALEELCLRGNALGT